jgi:hypothetical protein
MKILEEYGKKYKILRVGSIKKPGDECAFRSSYPHGYWFNVPKDDMGEKIKKDIYYYRRKVS